MSITVRLWRKEDLEAVKTDKWLATLLMNGTTFSETEIKALHTIPAKNRKTYQCYWYTGDTDEPAIIKATDEKMLKRFLNEEYTRRPDAVLQVITQYRPVSL